MDRLLFGVLLVPFVVFAESEHQLYQLLEKHEGYETRQYYNTVWITTAISDKSVPEIKNANNRLTEYCAEIEKNKYGTCSKNWPVLITVINDAEFFLSWLLDSEADVSTLPPDPDVTVQHLPGGLVYAKKFGGIPSIESGEENAKLLREELKNDGQTFNPDVYYAAGYDPILSLTHRNEILIFVK